MDRFRSRSRPKTWTVVPVGPAEYSTWAIVHSSPSAAMALRGGAPRRGRAVRAGLVHLRSLPRIEFPLFDPSGAALPDLARDREGAAVDAVLALERDRDREDDPLVLRDRPEEIDDVDGRADTVPPLPCITGMEAFRSSWRISTRTGSEVPGAEREKTGTWWSPCSPSTVAPLTVSPRSLSAIANRAESSWPPKPITRERWEARLPRDVVGVRVRRVRDRDHDPGEAGELGDAVVRDGQVRREEVGPGPDVRVPRRAGREDPEIGRRGLAQVGRDHDVEARVLEVEDLRVEERRDRVVDHELVHKAGRHRQKRHLAADPPGAHHA